MEQQKTLLKLEKVRKIYKMGEVEVEALKPSSLEVYEGELLVILGPSGSGKSTLLNIMGGMDSPTEGAVWFGGEDLARASERRLTEYRRHQVGFVFQFYNLIPDLTALENVAIAAELSNTPLSPRKLLEQVGMNNKMDSFPSQLSGGEQQRVAIARAAAKNPKMLLCDEPTGSLDCETGRKILSLLLDVNRQYGTTVVIVTHNVAIRAMGRRIIRMSSGAIAEMTFNERPEPPERISW
ncbi:ABC transporter related protein [Thermovirga lienii DSM 17291]|uniref:ABC transporter related protein n=1 Tax=Thermovirga lienii (strain ATCC BAA-1197 / DSM 17291 / Cas60314) TaxID=580340 RepID=G7V6Q4_THELD|nr:ABC transporter ATP-binding protein [Thermovirga lienii]AER66013.1 ABC transporter related protein [Thermovirga lienii DSM 17291]HCD71455.1 ABC transporter ATP-binding protein [Thermovirga lienii]